MVHHAMFLVERNGLETGSEKPSGDAEKKKSPEILKIWEKSNFSSKNALAHSKINIFQIWALFRNENMPFFSSRKKGRKRDVKNRVGTPR